MNHQPDAVNHTSPTDGRTAPSLQHILQDARRTLSETCEIKSAAWTGDQTDILREFAAQVDELQHILTADKSDSAKILSGIAAHIIAMADWLRGRREHGDFVPANLQETWREQFEHFLDSLPATISLPMNAEDWAPATGDSLPTRLWKAAWRGRATMRRFTWRLRHFRASQREQRDAGPPPPTRSFNLHDFLRFHLFPALAAFPQREWMQHMDLLRVQTDLISSISGQLYNCILSGDLFEPDSSNVILHIENTLELLATSRTQIEELQQQLRGTADGYRARTEEFATTAVSDAVRAWRVAGTVLYPAFRYSDGAYKRRLNRGRRSAEKLQQAWTRHMHAEVDDWHKLLLFSRLEFDSAAAFHSAAAEIEKQKRGASVEAAFEATAAFLETADRDVKNISTTQSTHRFEHAVQRLGDKVLEQCGQKILPALIEAVLAIEFEVVVRSSSSAFVEICNRLPASQRFFINRDAKGNPPRSETGDIPLRTIINDGFMRDLQKGLQTVRETLIAEREEIMRGISDVDDVIFYAIAAAVKMLHDRPSGEEVNSEARRIVEEGVQRARSAVTALAERMHKLETHAEADIKSAANNFLDKIRTLHNTEQLTALRLQATRTKVRAGFQDARKKVTLYRRWLRPKLRRILRIVAESMRSLYERGRALTGMVPPTVDQHATLQRMVIDAEKRINTLPYVYQRLFASESLTDQRFLIGRSKELAQLSDAYGAWRTGQFQCAAIVGESGGGKSSLINFAEKTCFGDAEIFRVTAERHGPDARPAAAVLGEALGDKTISDLPALQEALAAIERPVVFIVEDIHRMFMRTMDGFAALEEFLLFIGESSRSCFWLVSCKQYAWQFLDLSIGIARSFPLTIFLGKLSRKDTEQVVMQRHRFSGYQVEFEISERPAESRKYRNLKTEEEQARYRRNLYFDSLHSIAAGNIAVIMRIWLQSINSQQSEMLTIEALSDHEISLTEILREDDFFVLATILQHGAVDVEQISQILKLPREKCRQTLGYLTNKGVLFKVDEGYEVRLLLYRQVVRMLTRRNIIQ